MILQAGVLALVEDKNLKDARTVFGMMPYSEARAAATGLLTRGYAQEGARAAVEFISGLDLPEERKLAERTLAFFAVERRDVDALLLLHSSSTDPSITALCDEQLGKLGVASTSSATEMRDAYSYAALPFDQLEANQHRLTSFKSSQARAVATTEYTRRLFSVAPTKAANFALTAAPSVRPIAIRALAESWFNADSIELSEWANKLQIGADRDAVLAVIVEKLSSSDPNSAREVASAINDPTLRKRVTGRIR
jgi:hypothetical protein